MKYFFCSLAFLLLFISVKAQDYSCLSPEYKTFFTNGDNYLRGMRIDSVKTQGSNKISFPFKTARVGWFLDGQYADTSGGSWLGAIIIKDTAQGISYIPTENGDTVKIKNDAALNETWIFYQDTAARYYEATVIVMDTATFAGIFDSVKTILINAKEGNNIITADPLNGLKLVLSKDHGFFQVFGLYLFPFRDYYSFAIDYYLYSSGGSNGLNKELLTFKRTLFEYPTNQAIFDFDTGDIFISQTYNTDNYPPAGESDTILSRQNTDSSITYKTGYWKFHYEYNSQTYQLDTIVDSGISITTSYFGLKIDSSKMPEEWYNPYIYRYIYQDSSFCITSNAYRWADAQIDQNGRMNNFEPTINQYGYKEKLGQTYRLLNYSLEYQSTTSLAMAKKGGHFCYGGNNTVGIKNISNSISSRLIIYPNPVRETLNITLKGSAKGFSVCLYDLTGRVMTQKSSRQETLTLNVGSLMPGLYFLKVADGETFLTRKINIIH